MEDLRIYDFDFNLLGVEHKIISSSWKMFFNDIGKAELHLAQTADIIPVLFDNKYLLMTQGKKQAIITAKQIGSDCVIYGRTPDWILSKRVCRPFEKKTGGCETLVRELAESAFSDCDNFTLGSICGAEALAEVECKRAEALSTVISDMLSECGAGREVSFDIRNKCWVFKVIKGKERPLVISPASLNAYDSEYVFDLQSYFSDGIYEQESEGGQKEQKTLVKDEKSGILRWEAPLYSSSEADAKKELCELKEEESISAKLRSLEHGRDYDMGDVVTFSMTHGSLKRTKKYKIIGVSLWYEYGDTGEEPIFEEG